MDRRNLLGQYCLYSEAPLSFARVASGGESVSAAVHPQGLEASDVVVWDVVSGEQRLSFTPVFDQRFGIADVAYAADSAVGVAGWSTIQLFDVATGERLREFRGDIVGGRAWRSSRAARVDTNIPVQIEFARQFQKTVAAT